MAEPGVLPLRSPLKFEAGKREQVLSNWAHGASQLKVKTRMSAPVTAIPIGFALGYAICAALVWATESELYRIPLVISPKSYVFAFAITAIAALLSGLLIIGRLRRLDLVAVLKSRE